MSILNVTRLEVAKNRARINWLINNLTGLRQEVINDTETVMMELQEISGFMQRYFQLMAIKNKVGQNSQSLTTLLEHVRAQLDMSLGHLSPSIVTPGHLREVLLGIQTELPHHLRLPVDPTKELWKYNALGCVTLLENRKLLILMSIPLLDRESVFEIYQVINLPMPYPRGDQGSGMVARYKMETEYIALNPGRTKFMLLTAEEARKCRNDDLGACASLSPIYVAGNHKMCILELFGGKKEGIKRTCQVEVLANTALPQAISVSDGVWAVATQKPISLSRVCEGQSTRTLRVKPPLSLLKLPLGCSAFGISISLPLYYQVEEKYEEKYSIIELIGRSLVNCTEGIPQCYLE